jgi:type IV pilus assembly protein PilF
MKAGMLGSAMAASAGATRGLLLAALLTALLVAAGCTTTTTTVSGSPSGPSRDAAGSAEPADPQRRAAVRLELAGLYFSRGQPDTALEEVNRAIAARPELADAHSLRGLILASMGQTAAAEQAFRRAMQLAPGDGAVLHNFAWFLCQQRRFDDADAQFRATIALPQYRDTVRTLLAQGVCLARAGRWAEAESALARSYELDPANPTTAFNLAEVLLRRSELERARFYAQRINAVPEQVSAQSLWLAIRIERRLGNVDALQQLGRQLRERFPQAPETLQFERGRFDD